MVQNSLKLSYANCILVISLAIGFCGIMTIYSSQIDSTAPLYLPFKQGVFLCFSALIMGLVAKIKPNFWKKNIFYLALLSHIAIIGVLFWGVKINGMRGWYSFDFIFIQPADICKGIFLLLLIYIFQRVKNDFWRFTAGFAVCFFWTVPILLQPDYGTFIIYWGCFAFCYFLSGGKLIHLVAALTAFAGVTMAFLLRHPYALKRIYGFLNPELNLNDSSWHIRQFQLAIARGGLFGQKLKHAMWSNNYLPFSYNDSAFATMVETLGLAGAIMVGMLFLTLCIIMLKNAVKLFKNQNSVAAIYTATAIFAILFQTMLHVSVNCALLPTTGITMPFISYGGSSILSTFFILGIALSLTPDANTPNSALSTAQNGQ